MNKWRWQPEKSAKAWVLRMTIGPAMVIDGVCHFFTLGCFSAGLSLATARKIAMARFESIRSESES
jgi:hypothetical protein